MKNTNPENSYFDCNSNQNNLNTLRNTSDQVNGNLDLSAAKLSDIKHINDEIMMASEGNIDHENISSTKMLHDEMNEHKSNKKNLNVANYLGKRHPVEPKQLHKRN